VREIAFLLLPVINILCRSRNQVKVADKKLQYLILFFIGTVFVSELLKHLYFGEGLGSAFKTTRIGLPLFSSLLLVNTGIRADIEIVWRTLLWAISASAILTLLSPFVDLPIYPTIEGEDLLEAAGGRLYNSNSSFGMIGLYLLYKDHDRWYNQGYLSKLAAILSIVVLILSFNRTYLALLLLAFVYLSFSEFSLKKALTYVSLPLIAIAVFFGAYNYSEVIQRQIDRRIVNIVVGQKDLGESVFKDNRDRIYWAVIEKFSDNKWIYGLSSTEPIFMKYKNGERLKMSTTDTSLVNVILRYGILSGFLFLIIIYRIIMCGDDMVYFAGLSFFIASLNIDSLLVHNSIFFLGVIYLISRIRLRI
jgi:hypothetical protein